MDTRFVYTKTVKTQVIIFNSKTLSKVETFEDATKEMLCKCQLNDENLNAETQMLKRYFVRSGQRQK